MRLTESGRFALPAFAACAVLAGLAAALWGLWTAMFAHNGQYLVERVRISGDTSALTPEEIRSVSRIREGANQFSFSAETARRRLLAASLNIADARIRKRLPADVSVEIVPRRPIARVLDGEFIRALDRDGLVFPILARDEDRWSDLPMLLDGGETRHLPPGSVLHDVPGTPTEPEGRLARALQFVRVVDENPACPLRVQEADVSDRVYLVVRSPQGRSFRFVWEELPDAAAIRRALETASLVLLSPDSRSGNHFDVLLTPTNRVFASP